MAEYIKDYIEELLQGEYRKTAIDIVNHLSSYNLTFYKDNSDCWKDKVYYHVKYGSECICFIAIKDCDEPNNLWTIWSDSSSAYEDSSVSDEIKNVGWKYVDYCGNCGSCGGGKTKVIFGKSFKRVCGCTFRIDNATQKDLQFLKMMIDLRMKEILNSTALHNRSKP